MNKTTKAKKALALIAAVSMAFSATACGEDTVYIGNNDGKDIPSGVYLYYLLSAYYDAQSRMTETDTDVFAITIDDKNAEQWIKDKAAEDMRKYVAVDRKFDEYGLTLDDAEVKATKINLDSMWQYYGSYYEGLGISEDSFVLAYINSAKSEMLFEKIYGVDGERAVSDDELKAYMTDNYALVNFISMNLVDGEGNLLKSDGKAERMEMAKSYVERAKNGEDFDELNKEYQQYFSDLQAEAAAKAAEEAQTAPETDSEPAFSIVGDDEGIDFGSADVEPIEADEEAPTDEDELISDDEDEASDDEETSEETEVETEAETEEEETEETTAAETEAAEEETSETSIAWVEEEQASEDEEKTIILDPEEAEEETFVSNKQAVKKDSAVPDETVCKKIFEMSVGDITIVEEDEYYYIVSKLDIMEDESYFIGAKDSLLHEMSDDSYDALKKDWAELTGFELNAKAVERYTPKKFAEEQQ